MNSNEVLKRSLCKTVPVADKTTVVEYNVYRICIGNSMISSDIWHKYHEWYFETVIRAVRRVKFDTILKY